MQNSKINMIQIVDRSLKLRYMEACDSSYTISVLDRDNFKEIFDKIDKNAVFLGVEYEGNCAGYAAMYANNIQSKTAYITLIAVSEHFQRLHLGTVLMESCIKKALEAGMKTMKLEVLECDHGPIRFYEACGFRKCEKASKHSWYMEKEL